MGLYKPDTLQSSNTKSYPIAFAEEIGGQKQVADLTALYALKDYEPIIFGSGDATTAIGQLWYVQSEKSFYQLVDYSNIWNASGWSKTNLTSSANQTSGSGTTGDKTNFLTSITIAGDGSLSSTSYNIADLQASITASYNLASASYTYASNIGNKVDNSYDFSKYAYSYFTDYNTTSYTNLTKYIDNSIKNVETGTTLDLSDLRKEIENAYSYASNIGHSYDAFYAYQTNFNTSAYNALDSRIKDAYTLANSAYAYANNLGIKYDVAYAYLASAYTYTSNYISNSYNRLENTIEATYSYSINIGNKFDTAYSYFENAYAYTTEYNKLSYNTLYNSLATYITNEINNITNTTGGNVTQLTQEFNTFKDEYNIAYAYQNKFNADSYTSLYNDIKATYSYIDNVGKKFDVAYAYQNNFNVELYNSLSTDIKNIGDTVAAGVVGSIDNFTADKVNAYLNYTKGSETPSIQLDGATSSKAGVMSAEDKANLDAIYTGDKALVTPTASGTFTVYKSDGTTSVRTATGTSISVEQGYKVQWTGTWKWTHDNSKKDPTAVGSGTNTWGTTLNATGVDSSSWSSSVLSNTGQIARQSITAPKKGLVAVNGLVQPASGNDTTQVTVSWSTYTVRFAGITTSVPTTSDAIKALTKSSGGKSFSVSGVTINNTQYYVFAYPSSLGTLSKIIQDGATGIFDAFDRSTVSVTLDSGLAVNYYVYTSHYTGAFSGAKIDFS